jgi:hypothetical protein
MGASTPETGAKMLSHGRRMVKEGRDVKIANTKKIQLNGLRCFVIAMMKSDNRLAVEARILYYLEEDIGQSASVLR